MRQVFITGSTGYLGRAVTLALVERGHAVQALCRASSARRLPAGAVAVVGDALDSSTYASALRPDHVVVHLVGTPKPAPWKSASFERVDLGSVQQLARAVSRSRVEHIVYVSVAQPAPLMRAYVDARRRAEAVLSGLSVPHTFVRPWYVLGPGHRWPIVLQPAYAAASRVPSLRDGARRLGLVTLDQMVSTLVTAVETAARTNRLYEVPQIRAARPLRV